MGWGNSFFYKIRNKPGKIIMYIYFRINNILIILLIVNLMFGK